MITLKFSFNLAKNFTYWHWSAWKSKEGISDKLGSSLMGACFLNAVWTQALIASDEEFKHSGPPSAINTEKQFSKINKPNSSKSFYFNLQAILSPSLKHMKLTKDSVTFNTISLLFFSSSLRQSSKEVVKFVMQCVKSGDFLKAKKKYF